MAIARTSISFFLKIKQNSFSIVFFFSKKNSAKFILRFKAKYFYDKGYSQTMSGIFKMLHLYLKNLSKINAHIFYFIYDWERLINSMIDISFIKKPKIFNFTITI